MISRNCLHERIDKKGGLNGRKKQYRKTKKYENSF